MDNEDMGRGLGWGEVGGKGGGKGRVRRGVPPGERIGKGAKLPSGRVEAGRGRGKGGRGGRRMDMPFHHQAYPSYLVL